MSIKLPDEVQDKIQQTIDGMGEAITPHQLHRLKRGLLVVAHTAYQYGQLEALSQLMTVDDVAEHFDVSVRRARALMKNRHERFGVGKQIGNTWVIHRNELSSLEPEAKYRKGK